MWLPARKLAPARGPRRSARNRALPPVIAWNRVNHCKTRSGNAGIPYLHHLTRAALSLTLVSLKRLPVRRACPLAPTAWQDRAVLRSARDRDSRRQRHLDDSGGVRPPEGRT